VKRRICNILILFILSFIMTGCVKFNANMNIEKDKSMTFDIIYAVDTTYFGDEGINFEEDELKQLKESGFEVVDYSEGTMKGVKLFRNIDNIDDVSSSDSSEYSLSGLVDDENTNKNLFKIKKGLFKNRYTAKFEFNSADSSLNNSMSEDEIVEEDIIEDDILLEDEVDEEENSDIDFDSSLMMGSMDLSFNVNLPYSAISNNASDVTNDGKTLKWNLASNGEAEFIEFEFELYNMGTIYVCIGVAVVLVLLLVFFILKKFGKKKNNTNEQSTVGIQPLQNNDAVQTVNNDMIQNSMQDVSNNMEFFGTNTEQIVDNNLVNMDVTENVNQISPHQDSVLNVENKNIVESIPQQVNVQEMVLPNVTAQPQSNFSEQIMQVNDANSNVIVQNVVPQSMGANMNFQQQLGVPEQVSQVYNAPLQPTAEQLNNNSLLQVNNGNNNVGVQNVVPQQVVPSVLDMKPDMSFVASQNNTTIVQQDNLQSNNMVQNNVVNMQNQVNNMQMNQQSVSGMNFVSGPTNQNLNQ